MSDNELIRKVSRRIIKLQDYYGVCHYCNSPIVFEGEILAIELYKDDNVALLYPVDLFECPYCHKMLYVHWKHYFSLNVTKELEQVTHENS